MEMAPAAQRQSALRRSGFYAAAAKAPSIKARRLGELRVHAHEHARELQRTPWTRGHLHDGVGGPRSRDPCSNLVVLRWRQ